jgi:hypothetical protein
MIRIRDVYSGSRIADPTFAIPDPGSRVDKIPDPHPHQKFFEILTKKLILISQKLSPGCSSRIPDPGSGIFPSQIPDPDPQH